MAILEQVINMKGQGISERDIINQLSQQGVSPKEINDALKQAQIKQAVSGQEEEMQPSIMPGENGLPPPENFDGQVYTPEAYGQEQYVPMQEEYPVPQYQPQEQYSQEQYAPEQYPQEQYYQPGYEQYSPAGGTDANTMMEIADQTFSERIRKFQEQLDKATEISTLLQTKVENMSDRLKKMETIMDKLQIAILEKVGSYGKNLDGIKKEMSMMQDSFSKMISSGRRKKEKD